MYRTALLFGVALLLSPSAAHGQRVDDLPGPAPLRSAAVDSEGIEGGEMGVDTLSVGERVAGAAVGAVAGAAAGWLAYRLSIFGLFSEAGPADEARERWAMVAGAVFGAIVGAIRGPYSPKGKRGRVRVTPRW